MTPRRTGDHARTAAPLLAQSLRSALTSLFPRSVAEGHAALPDLPLRVIRPSDLRERLRDIFARLRRRRAEPLAHVPAEVLYTPFVAGPDTVVLYVSNAGRDDDPAWDGRSPERPKASVQAAYELLRDGSADWLLLRRGDTFPMATSLTWTKSGPPAASEGWMRLGAYGDESRPRPVLSFTATDGVCITVTPGYQSDRVQTGLAFTDLSIESSTRLTQHETASSGNVGLRCVAVEWRGPTSALPLQRILLENVFFSGQSFGVETGADIADLRIRSCTFHRLFKHAENVADTEAESAQMVSAVLTAAQGLLLEDNLFSTIQHPDLSSRIPPRSMLSHAVYVRADASGVVCRNNYLIKCPDGIMLRAGGVYEKNVSLETFVAANVGHTYGEVPTPGGVPLTVRDNLFVDPLTSLILGNAKRDGARHVVERNVVLCTRTTDEAPGLTLEARSEQVSADGRRGWNEGVHHATIATNWLSGPLLHSGRADDVSSYSDLTIADNVVDQGPAADPVGSFLVALGRPEPTRAALLRELLARDRSVSTKAIRPQELVRHVLRARSLG